MRRCGVAAAAASVLGGACMEVASSRSLHDGTRVSAELPRDVCWPDPDPLGKWSGHVTMADDVSGLHQTKVRGIVFPRCTEDVQNIINAAAANKWKVSMRGTQHSMGGHSIAPNGIVLDLKHMKRVTRIDSAAMTVTCEPGATWTDLIVALNPHGLSPRTMQSYSSFSVGGTIAVNGHGITTDFALVESVISFDIVDATGTLVRDCSREAEPGSVQRRLFGLVCGGYGMFGVVVSVTLKVNRNHALWSEVFTVTPAELATTYERIVDASSGNEWPPGADVGGADVDVKLARLDVTNLDRITVYLFRRRSAHPTVGVLNPDVKSMGTVKRLLYKWLVPPLQELRAAIEQQSGTALDWGEATDKNALMFETAEPLARLSEPMYLVDDTFILQEYFVPCAAAASFITAIKPIYAELLQGPSDATSAVRIQLLNTTIRHVKADTESVLAYSPTDTFAFVLYFRIRRNQESCDALASFQQRFIRLALSLGGSFYLPYLPHYSAAQFLAAYPRAPEFFKAKEELDKDAMFHSHWLLNFGAAFLSEDYWRRVIAEPDDEARLWRDPLVAIAQASASAGTSTIPTVSSRRTDSYRRLLADQNLRSRFRSQFLEHVFNIKDASTVFSAISRATWNARNATDADVYLALTSAFNGKGDGSGGGPVEAVVEGFRALRQVAQQKAEIGNETRRIISRLGRLGTIRDYVSIGDQGKLVRTLREALQICSGGATWIVNDVIAPDDDITAAIERGAASSLGTPVTIDFSNCVLDAELLPDECADLVTMNQGLHHIPQHALPRFLAEVRRVLRPTGLFIFREHDASPELIPMLDLAHSVFNVLTGVSIVDEANEVRAFRSVAEWRRIVSGAGFVDTMQFEMQHNDPTLDEMLCFAKESAMLPPTAVGDGLSTATQPQLPSRSSPLHGGKPALPFQQAIEDLPRDLLKTVREGLEGAQDWSTTIEEALVSLSPPASRDVIRGFVKGALAPIFRSIAKLHAQTAHVQPRAMSVDAVPEELFHAYAALRLKVQRGHASVQETVALTAINSIASQVFGIGGPDAAATAAADEDGAETAARGGGGPSESANSRQSALVDPSEVAAALAKLAAACPEALDSGMFESRMGFPVTIADALRASWPRNAHHDPDLVFKAATKLAAKLDAESWRAVSTVIDKIVVARPPLHFDVLLGRHRSAADADAPESRDKDLWFQLTLAFLGSPKITFTNTALFAARFYGAPELGDLWRTAQKMRDERLAGARGSDAGVSLPRDAQRALERAVAEFDANVQHVTFRGAAITSIRGVTEVLSATYQNKDVTSIVRSELFDRTTGVVDLEPASELDSVFNFGLTPLSVYFYGERVFSMTYRTVDCVPSSTLTRSAHSVLALLRDNKLLPRDIGRAMRLGNTHRTAGEVFNAYKLAEWLQVELITDFGRNLDTAPWYRYPFGQVTRRYFGVLRQLAGNVWARHGFSNAFFSKGFAVSLIPGVVMAVMFAQLRLLAAPLLLSQGTEYNESALRHTLVVRHRNGAAADGIDHSSWPSTFAHRGVAINQLHSQIFSVEVPVFRDFSRVVEELSLEGFDPAAASESVDGPVTFLSVAGFETVHIKVASISAAAAEDGESKSSWQTSSRFGHVGANSTPLHVLLGGFDGAQVVCAYELPRGADDVELARRLVRLHLRGTDRHFADEAAAPAAVSQSSGERVDAVATCPPASLPPLQYSSVTVDVVKLAAFVRFCRRHHIAVVQIFDFYFQ